MRLVIYTQNGKTIKFDDVKNLNYKADTLYFEIVGYAGDKGTCMFRDIAGYTMYEKAKIEKK